jgi:hypothetical protein
MAPVMQWPYSPWDETIKLHSGGEMMAALQAPAAVLCDTIFHSWGLYACLLNPVGEMSDRRTRSEWEGRKRVAAGLGVAIGTVAMQALSSEG